ncbi:MAG: hypothetical protein LLG04_16450 [Parachlamydia sp.]|nr:hypothetical protein [Parachlamydia sp.]
MSRIRLFLGTPLEGQLQIAFERVDPQLLTTFMKEDYLQKTSQKTTLGNQVFIGKTLETVAALPQLELSEAHLRSLLKKLLPDYPVESLSLHLLPIPDAT